MKSLAGLEFSAADFHRAGCDAPVGRQGTLNPEDLVDGLGQQGGLSAQLLLQLGVPRKIMRARMPTAAEIVPTSPTVQFRKILTIFSLLRSCPPTFFVHQRGGDVVLGLCSA